MSSKMYGFNVLFSLLGFVALGWSKDMCEKEIDTLCHHPGDLFFNFPENSNQLSRRCSEFTVNVECLIDYQENCKTEFLNLNMLHAALKTLNKICDKGSALFNAVADNGKCIKKFYNTLGDDRLDKCLHKIQQENEEKYEEIVFFSNDLGDEEREYCFKDLMQASCLVEALYADCGKTAKELLLQVLKVYGLNNLICNNHEEEAKNFMKELNINLEPENSLEDFIATLENETELD